MMFPSKFFGSARCGALCAAINTAGPQRKRAGRIEFRGIGVAWPHENGKGFTIELEACPIDGRLVLTEPKQETADTQATEAV